MSIQKHYCTVTKDKWAIVFYNAGLCLTSTLKGFVRMGFSLMQKLFTPLIFAPVMIG